MQQISRTLYLMGTVIHLSIEHKHAISLLDEAEMRLIDYDKRFSANRPDSQLMEINQLAGIGSMKVDEGLFELIKIGKIHSLQSNCFFKCRDWSFN